MTQYDAIIIGSGQGGTPLAKKLAKAGWKTALIEKRWIGGTCINDGCTPTKTMIASARVAYLVKNSRNWGINADNWSADLPAITERKEKVVHSFRSGSEKGLMDTENLDVIYGTATFTGERQVAVALNNGDSKELQAGYIFINTGTRTSIPQIKGLDTINYLTSTSIMDMKEIPEHLLIIGGAYIGLEFGQMFRRFSSKVTILEFSPTLLPKEDEDIAAAIGHMLQQEEITIYTGAKAEKVQANGGMITATATINGQTQQINCSHVLIASGRIPNTDGLHLDKTNVATEKGYIVVNDKLETSTPGIYAIGDVKGGPAFTHISYNDYVIIYKNLLHRANVSIDGRLVPYCLFTDPQLGRIGMTEKEAREKGYDIKVATLPMEHVARAIETGETTGLMKAIVDVKSGQILGAAVLATEGGEIMTVLQMAMMSNIGYTVLKDAVFAHPLYSESLNNLFMTLDS